MPCSNQGVAVRINVVSTLMTVDLYSSTLRSRTTETEHLLIFTFQDQYRTLPYGLSSVGKLQLPPMVILGPMGAIVSFQGFVLVHLRKACQHGIQKQQSQQIVGVEIYLMVHLRIIG